MQKEKLIIIGSGPAGLTAAIYAARANLTPLLIEGNKPGGQLMGTSAVENWPGEQSILGPKLMMKMRDQAAHLGTRILSESAIALDATRSPFLVKTDAAEYEAATIIIATGATPKKLGCPGEDQYWGKGITTCAVCDAAFYKKKRVLIVGGGDTAMEDASFLRRFTSDITVIHILDKLTASHSMQQRVISDPAIKIIYNSTVTRFEGDGKHLMQAIVMNQKTKDVQSMTIDGAFIAIGLKPNTEIFKGQLECDSWGYIKTHDNVKTSVPGIFASGDVQDFKYRQAITSAGSGCMAALEAERYLSSLD